MKTGIIERIDGNGQPIYWAGNYWATLPSEAIRLLEIDIYDQLLQVSPPHNPKPRICWLQETR